MGLCLCATHFNGDIYLLNEYLHQNTVQSGQIIEKQGIDSREVQEIHLLSTASRQSLGSNQKIT
jgi:hypothetical protein